MRKKQNTKIKQKFIHALPEAAIKVIELERNSLRKYLSLFLYYTGLRVSEALNLNIGQVEGQEYVTIVGKGRKERVIYLSNKAKKIVSKLVEAGNRRKTKTRERPLFLSQKGTRLSPSQAWRLVKEYESDKHIRVSPHVLRHTFATISLRKGVDVKYVSTQLGHSSTAITQDTYQHATLEDLKFTNLL